MRRPHPVYAAVYSVVAAAGEVTGYGRRRREALHDARGRLLILGLGPGYDLVHLPPTVTSVVAVEPDGSMRRRSRRRVAAAALPVALVGGVAEALPLAGASVDAVVCTNVLCSVTDPARSAAEIRRVLRPGGTVHVLEHVHAPPGTRTRRWQDRLDPAWSRMAAGCHVTRETRDVLEAAGFDTSGLRRTTVWPAPPMVGPHITGTAR